MIRDEDCWWSCSRSTVGAAVWRCRGQLARPTSAGTATSESTRRRRSSRACPVTLADAHGDVVTVESIDRIIPLDGDLAEVVFALGLGDRVVATDLSATFPPEADALPEIGYQRALSAEPIAAFEPTVLLATDLAGPRRDARPTARPRLPAGDDRSAESTPAARRPRSVRSPRRSASPNAARRCARDVQAAIDAASEAGAAAAAAGDRPRVMALYLRGERCNSCSARTAGWTG